MIAWAYGSGFPKSLDVSKAIDRMDASEEQERRRLRFTAWVRETGVTSRQIDEATSTNMGGHYLTAASQPAIPTPALWALLRPHCGDVPEWVDQLVQRIEAEREVIGTKKAIPGVAFATTGPSELAITAPATPEAQQWAGWGTALKPALEPITVARKPLTGTVAANVLAHGTGGLNVDGCRVEGEKGVPASTSSAGLLGWCTGGDMERKQQQNGRWPANLIHDGSDEVVGLFPDVQGPWGGNGSKSNKGANSMFGIGDNPDNERYKGQGSAARFFYCAKTSKKERGEGNNHPTVKPIALMTYLCRLVTPPGGVVLDPFMGSGSTGIAALQEGFDFVGIERDPEYLAIAESRIMKTSQALATCQAEPC
jgi:hypothetical protein